MCRERLQERPEGEPHPRERCSPVEPFGSGAPSDPCLLSPRDSPGESSPVLAEGLVQGRRPGLRGVMERAGESPSPRTGPVPWVGKLGGRGEGRGGMGVCRGLCPRVPPPGFRATPGLRALTALLGGGLYPHPNLGLPESSPAPGCSALKTRSSSRGGDGSPGRPEPDWRCRRFWTRPQCV